MPAPTLSKAFIPSITPRFYGFHNNVFEVRLHEPGGTAPHVPEALVQEIWRTQRLGPSALFTSDGVRLTVLKPGTLNTDTGPDFIGAHLLIGSEEWVGDVEIHTASSGWFDHRHHLDTRYNGVVLHVALYADIWTGGLLREDDRTLPELILYPYLDTSLRRLLYDFYTRSDGDFPCAASWTHAPDAMRTSMIQELAVERIKEKKNRLAAAYLHTPHLATLLYERLFAGLGYAKNTEAMTTLARRLPPAQVNRLIDPLDREALFFGTAGLLPAPGDLLRSDRATADYAMGLCDRFERLNTRLEMTPMEPTAWRFFRLRPANFPPLRIAQGAAWFQPDGLLHHDPIGKLVAALRDDDPTNALRTALHARPGTFWETHIRLEKATRPFDPAIGRSRIDALLANAVVPLLLLYAEQTNDPTLEAQVLDVLRALPPEHDEVTRRFEARGTKPNDALTAQGLHQLYRTRCSHAQCLTCPVGQFLLDRTFAAESNKVARRRH